MKRFQMPAHVAVNNKMVELLASASKTAHVFCWYWWYIYKPQICHMNEIERKLRDLFHRIPRRHNAENVKEIYSILDAYENLLQTMETDEHYAKEVGPFFEALDPIRATIKKSQGNKVSKKAKDVLFDEASGALKDAMEEAMKL